MGVRKILSEEDNLFLNNNGKFVVLGPSFKYWYADPIIREINGKQWIFAECFDRWKRKGMICVINVKDIGKKKPRIVIDEPFHMSFPEVFEYKNEHYMIPETHSVSEFRIYKMGHTVYDWKLVDAIKTEYEYSDTVVHVKDENIYILSTEKKIENPYINRLHFFKLKFTDNNSSVTAIELQIKCRNEYGYDVRNGGSIINIKDDMYRVIQESEWGHYGKNLLLRHVEEIDDEGYVEKNTSLSAFADSIGIRLNALFHILKGTHTYGLCGNSEVVDIKCMSFSLSSLYHGFQNIFKLHKSI